MEEQQFKQRVVARVDALQGELWNIALKLYEYPEVAFKEYRSASLLSEILAEAGFTVERAIGDIETSFRATVQAERAGPKIAFLAEYDALPEIGHACGHNLIASAAVGAGLAMQAVIQELGGSVQVIGTPAEEGGGGKIIMKEAGVFDGLDAAMMVHPASKDMVLRGSLASTRLKIEFHGKPAHAAAKPHLGINALDAVLLTFNNINALRQHLHMSDRVAGIITHGGVAANIVPAYTSAEFSVRGRTSARRAQVLDRVIACAQAGAAATGCRLDYKV
ncbi:MAG: M20 family metallopeptidase, partial [Anaerolineales bacterium]